MQLLKDLALVSTREISELFVTKKSDQKLHFASEESYQLLKILSCHMKQRQSFRKLFSHIIVVCSVLRVFSSKLLLLDCSSS
jgi:hypothetical protein